MNQRAERVDVEIEELKDSARSDDGGGVVLETEATVDGERLDTTIEVDDADVPAVAVALLNTDGGGNASGTAVPPAIRCLAAGVVHTVDGHAVRIHLQFESGQVLPIEMSPDAALALCRGLSLHCDPGGEGEAAPLEHLRCRPGPTASQ